MHLAAAVIAFTTATLTNLWGIGVMWTALQLLVVTVAGWCLYAGLVRLMQQQAQQLALGTSDAPRCVLPCFLQAKMQEQQAQLAAVQVAAAGGEGQRRLELAAGPPNGTFSSS
jgi:hypothetical protein